MLVVQEKETIFVNLCIEFKNKQERIRQHHLKKLTSREAYLKSKTNSKTPRVLEEEGKSNCKIKKGNEAKISKD